MTASWARSNCSLGGLSPWQPGPGIPPLTCAGAARLGMVISHCSSTTGAPMPAAKQPASNDTFFILSLVVFNFISFISIGIPLASLPGYIHENLGFSTAVAGIVIGAQYLTTLLCRPLAGRLADERGAKKTVLIGMTSGLISGLLLLASALLEAWPMASIAVMIGSRLILGFAQSLIGISAISWGISRLGAESTARGSKSEDHLSICGARHGTVSAFRFRLRNPSGAGGG